MPKKRSKLVEIVSQVDGLNPNQRIESASESTTEEIKLESEQRILDIDERNSESARGSSFDKSTKKTNVNRCPHCGSEQVVRFGTNHKKPRFRCKSCRKTFISTTGTIMFLSHSSADAWEQVIMDTINGCSLEETRCKIGVSVGTAFNMRHKILLALEQIENDEKKVQSHVSEVDETFAPESQEGTELPDSQQEPSTDSAVDQERGFSDEQVCAMTGIEQDSGTLTTTENVTTMSSDEIASDCHDRIAEGTDVISDGDTGSGYDISFGARESDLTQTHSDDNYIESGLKSFIEHRQGSVYRGIATKYIDRYNTLLAKIYGRREETIDKLIQLLVKN